MTSRTCTWTRSRPITTPMGAATRPSATAAPRRMRSEQPGRRQQVEWYRPLPPPPQNSFLWSARDNVNYNETAMLAALDDTAQQSKTLLRNYYLKGLHSYRRGLEQPPYGFLIPDGQGDPQRVAQMVARLMSLGDRGAAGRRRITLKEGTFLPAPTWCGSISRTGTTRSICSPPQQYPKDAAEAYDDVSWEFPAHYHLAVDPDGGSAGAGSCSSRALTAAPHVRRYRGRRGPGVPPQGYRPGGPARGALCARALPGSDRRARLQRRWHRLPRRAPGSSRRNRGWPRPCARRRQAGTGFRQRGDRARGGPSTTPRCRASGLWVPWADTDTIGWARYSLDQRHIPYSYVRDEDIRAGKLKDKYDVLLYPHVDLELAEQIEGLNKAWGPMPFKKTAPTPSLRHAGILGRHHRRHRLRRACASCSSSSTPAAC